VLHIPMIAAIDGYVIDAGLELAVSLTYRIGAVQNGPDISTSEMEITADRTIILQGGSR
jgi:enoyl-CoA hydratase/carnithine racemase